MTSWSIVPAPGEQPSSKYVIPFPRGCKGGGASVDVALDAHFRPEEEVDPRRGEPFPLLVVAVQQVLDLQRQGELADIRPDRFPGVSRVNVHDRVPGPTSGEKVRGPELELVALEPPVDPGLQTWRGRKQQGCRPTLLRDTQDPFRYGRNRRRGIPCSGIGIRVGHLRPHRRVKPPGRLRLHATGDGAAHVLKLPERMSGGRRRP